MLMTDWFHICSWCYMLQNNLNRFYLISKVYRLVSAHSQRKCWNQYQERRSGIYGSLSCWCNVSIVPYLSPVGLVLSRCQPSFTFKEASQQRSSPQSLLLSMSQRIGATSSQKQCPPLGRRKWEFVKSKFIFQHPSLTLIPSSFTNFEQHAVSMTDDRVMRITHVFLAPNLFMFTLPSF